MLKLLLHSLRNGLVSYETSKYYSAVDSAEIMTGNESGSAWEEGGEGGGISELFTKLIYEFVLCIGIP
jgi:hypothetical protein